MGPVIPPRLWTIGHGLASAQRLIELLTGFEIEAVADVRTVPFSARAPHFDRPRLESTLKSSSISYRYFGKELGGRPSDPSFYDESGHVLYRRLAESPEFKDGMSLLVKGANQKATVLLCSESAPDVCHRTLLVGRVARLAGIEVVHILHSGQVAKFDDALVTQSGLPGFEKEDSWRSLVRVRQEPQRRDSLSGSGTQEPPV
jgi:uncharacterized protein (DUF488 family)